MTKAIDVEDKIAPGEMPNCPLCDNELQDWERACVIVAHGSMGIAHADCIDHVHDERIGESLDVH
jgi:hypothetical protein